MKASRGSDRGSRNVDTLFVLHVVFIAACLAGLLYQTSYILSNYMQYGTGSIVTLKAISSLDPPDMTVCIRYTDILSEGGLTDADKRNTSSWYKRQRVKEIQSNLTVKQIFDFTPDVPSALAGCIHKIPDSYTTHIHMKNRSRCLDLFNGTRFYTQENICYKFQLRVNKSRTIAGLFKYDNIATSLAYPGLFYALLLDNKTLGEADKVKIVAHARDSLPFDDLAYGQYFSRQVDNVVKYSEISVFYQMTLLELLPPPYQTACRKFHEFSGSKNSCISECLKNHTISKFNKLPFSVIETRKLDYKLISGFDTASSKFNRELDILENYCERMCRGKQCKRPMFATNILKEGQGEFPNFVVRLYVPLGPIVDVYSIPASSMQDLLVYISSSLGLWLGFSVMASNPLDLWKTIVRQRKVNRGEECHCPHCSQSIKSLSREMDQLQRHQKKMCLGYDYNSGHPPTF